MPFFFAVLSGAVTALCWPRLTLSALAWFSLVPLFVALGRETSIRRAAWLGFAFGFSLNGVAFYWIYNTTRFAGEGIPVALLAWFALSAFQGLQWALIGAAGRWSVAPLPEWLRPWGWALVYAALAVAWERWTPRMPGDLLGYSQGRHLTWLQIGALAGPHALGFLVALSNATLAGLWERQEREWPRALARSAAAAAGVALGVWGYGAWSLGQRTATTTAARTNDGFARVELLQPSIDQYQKWNEGSAGEIVALFDELLARPRAGLPELIVWPESSIPRWISRRESPKEAAKWGPRLAAQQLVGVVTRDGKGRYNTVYHLGADGKVAAVYDKRKLVPFGEWVPFGELLIPYIGILAQLGQMLPGPEEQPLFATPLGTVAVTICYESMFSRWAREDAARGARIVVNVTNDGWYKDTWAPYQHFAVNMVRSIENRTWTIRSGNTGISGLIDPWGVTTAKLDLNERGRLDAELPREDAFPARSFYARVGDWFGTLCLWLAFALFCAAPGLNLRKASDKQGEVPKTG